MYNQNLILMTDSYKSSHFVQYPPGTEYVYSYIESRGGTYDRTLVFGLQMFLSQYLTRRITQADVDEAAIVFSLHGVPFNREGWEYIVNEHGGALPLLIRAVPEGSVIPTHNVLATIVNTDPKCFWLTSYMETAILRALWYPTTVATQSWSIKQRIRNFLEESSDDPKGQLPFKLHDFGGRGVSSSESAAIGGLAHLVNFQGTDTVEALLAARSFYGEDMAGYSIPAAEHSTITSWGKEREVDAYRNMLTQFAKPGALVAVVSDSYDLWNAVENLWGDTLKQQVIDSGATVVIRPDSGDPVAVPLATMRLLADKFGTTTNSKGFRVLNNVRVIQGDGINEASITRILNQMRAEKFSGDNIAFGMGGALLQGVNRDTQKFAMKCSAVCINGAWQDAFKSPATDKGKSSKRGRLALIRENSVYETVPVSGNEWRDILRPVFRDGALLKWEPLQVIRQRSNLPAMN